MPSFWKQDGPILEILNPMTGGQDIIATADSDVRITTTLALGSQELSSSGAIIVRLSAIEDLASMSILCTDKTGQCGSATPVFSALLP